MFRTSGEGIWPVACCLMTSRATAREEELAMARQGKTLPARRTGSEMDDSLLIRSAESLGRMIGSLQRQLDGASKKLNETSGGFAGVFGVDGRSDGNGSARATGGVSR